MFDFDKQVDRSRSDSAKWRKYANQDILPMWVADMDYVSPPAVLEALRQRVSHGVFGYGVPPDDVVEAVLDHIEERYAWNISPQWIVWLPGLVTGLNVACRATGRSDDTIVTTVPVYPPFLTAPAFSNKKLKTSPMSFVDRVWQMDLDNLADCLDSTCSLFLLCNPHNPTGRVFSEDELIGLADLLLKNGLIICSDEIHCDLVLDSSCRHRPIAALAPEIADRTITLMAPSKTYNIPGLGCAFAVIANPGLRRRFRLAMSGIVPHVNVLGFAAAGAAYRLGGPWLSELITYLRENRDMVFDAVNSLPGLHMGAVQATYLAWIDTRGLGRKDPYIFFEKAGVGLSDGKDFGGPGFVRLNFGCTRGLLQDALARISHAVAKLGG